MIRINLLPYRAARKRENIKRQITLYILCVILSFAVMAYFYVTLNGQLSGLKDRQEELKAELATLQETIKKINALEKKTTDLKNMLSTIKDLEKGKTGPVMLLAEISSAVPKDKLWLKSLQESKGILSLKGTAMDNETVALFMTNLESQEHINQVDLGSSRLRSLPEHRLRVSDFELQCLTYAYKDKAKETTTKKKSRRRK